MDLCTVFPNLNVMWTRWSDYEVVTDRGAEYLVPAAGATALTFNCAEQAETLTSDALELGRQIMGGSADANRLCAAFAAHHGLLGLGAEEGQPAYDSAEVPPCFRPLNSREYGEDLGSFQVCFHELYQHFLTTRGEVTAASNPRVMDLSGFLSYRLTSGQTPQLVWQVRSMRSVIHFTYAALISSPKQTLKVCKNCGKVYYNSHAKSEFCGARCRNYYNVRAFRGKERVAEPSGTSKGDV